MTKLRSVLTRAEKIVTPTAGDKARLEAVARKVLGKVEAASLAYNEVTGAILGGSYAKGTWLPADAQVPTDIDVFVRIAKDVDERKFESIGLKVGREASRGYKHGKKYAQHPYTEATVDGIKVNVVPCYDVGPGEWKSAADRSPYHVEFVNENFDEEKRTQARLLKRFMRTVGVYGAEIENEGFSGYAAEVLVHSHGSFEGVLRYFADLKPSGDSYFALKDPIDDKRELATAISRETVARMVLASRAFLREPGLAYFTGLRRRVRWELIGKLYVLRFDHGPISEDTLWGELKRSSKQLVRHLEERGFGIVRAAPLSDNKGRSAIVLMPRSERLPPLEERAGPGVEMAAEVERFVSKNRERARHVWVGEDGRVHTLQRRDVTELARLLERLVGPEVDGIGASRQVAASIRRTGRVLKGKSVRREASRERWLAEGLEEFLADTIGTD